jgi:nicotinate-nucleotide adenylyltransferase
MARAAFAEVPRAVVLDAEVRRPGPSYTYDTVAELMAPTHGCVEGSWAPEDAPRVVLLLGADAAREAHTWHRWRELQGLVELVVFARRGTATLSPEERGTLGVGAVLDLDLPDISATALRARLAAGELPEEIPPAVRDVIVARHLYGREGVRPYDGGQI